MMLESAADTVGSSYRERLIEHLFVGEVLRELWLSGVTEVEVLRCEVDGAGYDIVLECQSVVRHVQLKTARLGGRRANVSVNIKLGEKPSGCVIWIYFDPGTMSLRQFFWFGGAPGKRLPALAGLKVGKHTKGDATGHKAERPNIRVIPKGRFERIETVAGLVHRLFGAGKIHS